LSTGATFNPDMNSGDPNGLAQLVENWHNASRQHAAICYDLRGVHVITETVVQRVLFDGDRAVGVELLDGAKLMSRKEIILSAGAIRTPQVLMLSGIGPLTELSKHNIQQKVDLPVGQNLHDHGSLNIVWKLKHPEQGLAFGSPGFNKPEYMTGNPMDWFLSAAAPDADLRRAAEIDGEAFQEGSRTDYEVTVMYAVTAAAPVEMAKMDGTHITTGILCLSPTSRGTISLVSDKASDTPLIDPKYFATEHDRVVMRSGIRKCLEVMESAPLQDIIESETPPPGMPKLTCRSSDKEIDDRLKAMSWSWFHTAGTAAMGKVVDTQCNVKGVRGLRVVDASIMPLSITAHLQASVYAIAEAAADIIAHAA